MSNTVVYVMEAASGELVATSNGESIMTDAGVQKEAANAATELISLSAARIASIRATATGAYSDPNNRISTTVVDYQRASGTLHHKIVLASYLSATPGTIVVPASAPVIVPVPAPAPAPAPVPIEHRDPAPAASPACPTVARAQSNTAPVTAAITCTALVVVLALGLAALFVAKKRGDQALVYSDGQKA